MPHKYDKYMEAYAQRVRQEREQLAKLPKLPKDTEYEIVLDNDATEQEVQEYLYGKLDEDSM